MSEWSIIENGVSLHLIESTVDKYQKILVEVMCVPLETGLAEQDQVRNTSSFHSCFRLPSFVRSGNSKQTDLLPTN
jgi:hypothetical protein